MSNLETTAGTFIVNDTVEKTIDFQAIVALEDTIFTSIKISGSDVKDNYISNSAAAIKAGSIINPALGVNFSGIQLTSGSVAIIL